MLLLNPHINGFRRMVKKKHIDSVKHFIKCGFLVNRTMVYHKFAIFLTTPDIQDTDTGFKLCLEAGSLTRHYVSTIKRHGIMRARKRQTTHVAFIF